MEDGLLHLECVAQGACVQRHDRLLEFLDGLAVSVELCVDLLEASSFPAGLGSSRLSRLHFAVDQAGRSKGLRDSRGSALRTPLATPVARRLGGAPVHPFLGRRLRRRGRRARLVGVCAGPSAEVVDGHGGGRLRHRVSIAFVIFHCSDFNVR